MKVLFLGTGPASGWPSYGYPKEKRRRPSTYAIQCGETFLFLDTGSVEAVMDGIKMMAESGIERVSGVLLSHAHNDHWAGLNNLRWGPRTKVFLTEDTLYHPYFKEIADKPFSLDLTPIEFFEEFEVGKVKVTPFPLNHIPGTSGFLVECNGRRIAYALDTKGLPKESMEFLKGKVDLLIIDSALPIGETGLHNTYEEALLIGKEIEAKVAAVHLLPMVREEEVLRKAKEIGVEAAVPDDLSIYEI
ncbi:hypothetical protein IPA_02360 [Ignicoccus pacificus DSM 13166]|uniref:Metallo-beta-lactamase domain-containing protein n=1 Tax=Ignicoccus pacificus DSM 13166 TaxID=940294 RepID=A0A977KAP0_9CREN|nr:hypothetical protein IPA_02360 [Ignicoccus pacificus DSM 13166]